MAKVCVLLATYNGAKYLEKQLNSLIEQTYEDVSIIIRDDGSSDGTLDIIEKYKDKYCDRIQVIYDDENLGYPDCFWRLLSKAPEADYYSFCDQDDIWYPEKLNRAVKMMSKDQSDMPKLYYHCYDICDANDNKYDTYYPGNIKDKDILKHFFYTYTMGFTMVINKNMRDKLLSYEPEGKRLAHDVWCIFNAYYFGNVYYDEAPQAAYRRHNNTVTSAGKGYIPLIKSWWKKEICGNEMEILRGRLEAFFRENKESLDAKDGKKFLLFMKHGNAIDYFRRLFYPNRLKDSLGGEVATRVLFLLNK